MSALFHPYLCGRIAAEWLIKVKEYDRVELIVEKDRYAKEGVHKGMDGIICDPHKVNGTWLVSFDQYGNLPEIACISVKEEDLKIILEAE